MKNVINLALVAAVVFAGVWLTYFGPYYKDAYTMEEVVETVVLSWGAFNRGRAEAEVSMQLRKREIDYITPEHCEFFEGGGERTVTCSWQVDVYPPLMEGRRLDFEVAATIDANGELVKN